MCLPSPVARSLLTLLVLVSRVRETADVCLLGLVLSMPAFRWSCSFICRRFRDILSAEVRLKGRAVLSESGSIVRVMVKSTKTVVRKVKLLELYNSEEHPNWSTYRRFRKTLKELYLVPGHFRAWIVACGLQGIQQLCEFNSLMYFSAIIFQVIGFNKPTAV
ncbi:hypothetical protein V1506DRAFT_541668 [Lipomyces tetrasporus]